MATISPNSDFDPEEAAKTLKQAMKGIGSDESEIIQVLTSHDNEQRQEIKENFKQAYGQDLEDELKSELKGNLEDVVMAICTTPRLYDVRQLRESMKGVGTDEGTLIEIMCSRSNDEIEELKAVYAEEYERDLESDLQSETSGHFERLLVCQVTGARDEDGRVDKSMAVEDAQAMYDAGEGQFGTDESEISRVLSTRSYAQLRATFYIYESLAGQDIEEVAKQETNGALQDGWLAIIRIAKSVTGYFTKVIYKSMKGGGTEDNILIRAIVSRSEIDLADIKEQFEAEYEQSLADFINDDCRGDYQQMLLAIIGA